MQKIIVASDLSERSRPAMRRAVELAVAANAHLDVLSVVNDAIPAELAHPVQVGATTILTEQVTADLGDRALDFDVSVTVGDPIEKINEAAVETGADLLIVGLHRRRKFLDQIRETTMEHIIRSSRIPVLLVAGAPDLPYQRVLCGVALSGVCTSVLRIIPSVAPTAETTLFHAHAVSFREEAERDFESWKAIFGLPDNVPKPVYVEASPRDALDGLMKAGNYDLVAIGGHTRSDGGRYFVGRFTAGLIRNPPCDLLIAK